MPAFIVFLIMISCFISDSIQREHNAYPILSEALRFIDLAQNSLCHQDHKTNSSIQYSVVTIGIGGGFAAQVQICCNYGFLQVVWLPNILLYILHENIHSNFSLSFVIVPTGCIRVDASFRCFELQRTSAYSWEAMGLLRGTRMQTCAARVDLLFPAHDQVRSVAKIFSRLSLYII